MDPQARDVRRHDFAGGSYGRRIRAPWFVACRSGIGELTNPRIDQVVRQSSASANSARRLVFTRHLSVANVDQVTQRADTGTINGDVISSIRCTTRC